MNKYTTVAAFMDDLDADKRAQVEVLQDIIKKAHPTLEEHIKWNAPSYILEGEDRVTFNLQNKEGVVKLVLHMGATRTEDKKGAPVMADASGLIVWQSDIRGIMSFADLAAVTAQRKQIGDIVARWLAISC
jgi:hypothetical protein